MKKTYKLIIDTDPGVDDTNALAYILNDPQFDIKLITTANGNINIHKATRNMLHILDIFGKDIPVVEGYEKRLGDNTEDATFLHGIEGLGGYNPPKTTTHHVLKQDCADAMYETLKKYPKQITMVVLGPHTNFAYLLIKHPDSKDLIKDVLMMGGSPNGIKVNPNHNSFNIRTDAPAFKHTIDSGLPIIMCPSSIGRDQGYYTEEEVIETQNTNIVGRFLAKTFETYWEPGYSEKIIATNDLCAVYYLTHPRYYKTRRADIELDTEKSVGKTTAHYNHKGQFKIVTKINRKKFRKMLLVKLREMNNLKFTNHTFLKNLEEEK